MNRAKAVGIVLLVSMTMIVAAIAVQPLLPNRGTRLDTLYAFLQERHDLEGEGGYTLPDSTVSRCEPTYSAIYTLDKLGYLDSRPPMIDLFETKNFTQKLQWKSGGEDYVRYGGYSSYIAGPVTIGSTFASVLLMQLFDRHTDIQNIDDIVMNYTSLLVYVNKTHTTAGGFGSEPGKSADILSTYKALYLMNFATEALQTTSPVDNMTKWLPDSDNTTAWILQCRVSDSLSNGFKLSPNSTVAGVTATAASLLALDQLDDLDNVTDLQGIGNWMVDRQVNSSAANLVIGGFTEGVNTNDTNLFSTFYALKGLSLIPGAIGLNVTSARDFIISCQAKDGSWAFVPGAEVGDITYIQMAIESLLLLEVDARAVLSVSDPNNPAGPFVDWRLVFVVAVGIIALVLAVMSVRRD